MVERIWCEIIGGMLGPALGKWLYRFKCRVAFLGVTLVGWISFFGLAVMYRGWQGAIALIFDGRFGSWGPFVLVPVGFGLGATVLIYLASLSDKHQSR